MTHGRRIVLLCPDPIGAQMRGMGIRYSEIARALRDAGHPVTLAAPEIDSGLVAGVEARTWPLDDVRELRRLLSRDDAVLAPPSAPHVMRELRRCRARVVVDLYAPAALEVLERDARRSPALREINATVTTDQLADALRSGDFFVCASERQRDLWIGAMLASDRITPRVYARDPTLRTLIDVLPFGIPAAAPTAPAVDPIRERFPQIADAERVLLWNGGLWAWLDAPAAIGAVARVRAGGVPLRLVFMGASSAGGAGRALAEARAAVAAHRLGDAVLFNETWVDYADRAGWLLASEAVISTHRDHLEARFAFRTRLLDCLWTGVPPIVTDGDDLAALIAAEDLGAVAAPGDVDALAAGIERVLDRGRDAYAARLRAASRAFEWPRVIAPLLAFLSAEAEVVSRHGGRRTLLSSAAARPLRRTAQRVTRLTRARRGR